jgi:hypothetical protein
MHYGAIFAICRELQDNIQRLLVVSNQVTADEMQNQMRYIRVDLLITLSKRERKLRSIELLISVNVLGTI